MLWTGDSMLRRCQVAPKLAYTVSETHLILALFLCVEIHELILKCMEMQRASFCLVTSRAASEVTQALSRPPVRSPCVHFALTGASPAQPPLPPPRRSRACPSLAIETSELSDTQASLSRRGVAFQLFQVALEGPHRHEWGWTHLLSQVPSE